MPRQAPVGVPNHSGDVDPCALQLVVDNLGAGHLRVLFVGGPNTLYVGVAGIPDRAEA